MSSFFKVFDFRIIKLLIVLIALLFIGCKNAGKADSLLYEQLCESLERSNKNLEQTTVEIYNTLIKKKEDISRVDKATIWGARADSVIVLSHAVLVFVDSLQNISGKINDNEWQKSIIQLDSVVKSYQASIFTSDAYARKVFDRMMRLNMLTPKGSMDSLGKKALLLKLKNDIKNTEYMAVRFCNAQIGWFDGPGYYDKFSAIVCTNTTRLGVNEELTIQAGICEFSSLSKPSFIINRKPVAANSVGIGELKLKVSSQPGKYKVPVKISFTTQTGKAEVFEKNVEYTVVE